MAWRYLSGNKAEWRPQNVLCVDTETSRECPSGRPGEYVERFRLGVAKLWRLRRGRYHPTGRLVFKDTERFWAFVESSARPNSLLWVFAHNVGFDSRVLGFWQLLDCGRFVRTFKRDRKHGSKTGTRQTEEATGLLVTSDPPTIVEAWCSNGGKIRLVDTLNYWPTSLSVVGSWVGLPKLPFPDPWEPDTTWLEYCERDVDILAAAVLKYVAWVRENQLGVFSFTLASQAMHGYRHTAPAKSIVIHDELEVQKLEGESYYGGEVYIGRIGHAGRIARTSQLNLGQPRPEPNPLWTDAVHQCDVNSLFPAVMRDKLYPRRLINWRTEGDAKHSLVARMAEDCIAECLINTNEHGVYSRRRGRSGRFTGLFVTVLVGPELVNAIQAGIVLAIRRYARYEMAELFRPWVERWWLQRWSAKLAGNTFESELCKRLMNSLYGKFAQKRHEWEDLPDTRHADRWACWTDLDATTSELTHYRSIAGTVQKSVEKGYHPNAFVAISSFVTSYARQRMRLLRDVCGVGHCYYQGIDSLYVSDTGLARLRDTGQIDAGSLGLLRHEATAESAYFAGWGLYKFGDKWVRTAIGRGAIECHPGEFQQDNFERLSNAIAHEPIDGVRVQTVKKTIAAASPVGIIGKDGWVKPLPAVWGDNPSETTDPRGFYNGNVCDRRRSAFEAITH